MIKDVCSWKDEEINFDFKIFWKEIVRDNEYYQVLEKFKIVLEYVTKVRDGID